MLAGDRHRRHTWNQRILVGIVATCAIVLIGEVAARQWLGLGDPPLHIADPEIEYLSKPGTYHRFGNTIHINAYHMRSPEFPVAKTQPQELRILFLGDSVINGGALTDQKDLATEILRSQLSRELERPVVVGNVSAGSWGPGNLLAYVKRFGIYQADIVVLVLNGMDIGDNPTAEAKVGVDPSFPAVPPASAVMEAMQRYVAPRLALGKASAPASPAREPVTGDQKGEQRRSLEDLASLCGLVERSGAKVLIMYSPTKPEIAGSSSPGGTAIREFAVDKGYTMLDMGDAFRDVIEAGGDPFRASDTIHPNAVGQRIMAQQLTMTLARGVNGSKEVCGPR